MKALVVCLLAIAVSCKVATKQEAAPSVSAVASVAVPTPSIAPAPVTAKDELEPGQHASSVAVFTGDRLTACIDSVWVFPQIDAIAAKAAKPVQELLDEEVEGFVLDYDTILGKALTESAGKEAGPLLRPPGKPQSLRQICGKQFPGRLVVASCVLGVGKKIRVGIEIKSFDANPKSDRFMRGCLLAKGNWQEMSPDDRDFKREQLQQRLRELQQQQ